MKERDWIEPIVERVVGQVLDSHVAQLRAEIVRQVVEQVAAASATAQANSPDATASSSAELARAVFEIQLGSSQREILKALLDASSRYASRVALFVVKGPHATGWQGRGFSNESGIKDFSLDEKAAAIMHAISNRVVVNAPVAEQDERFIKEFGAPASGSGRILPLLLKDKVAALIYADAGVESEGIFDAGSLELLVLSTSAWLEINSLRKLAQKEPGSSQGDSHAAVPSASASAAAQAAPAFNDPFASHNPTHTVNDPFASHNPGHAMAAAASAASSHQTEAPPAKVEIEPLPVAQEQAVPAAEIEPVASATPGLSPEDQETHRKAQRFSRLLVDEIKLYNQAKVSEGRKNKDLYDRLKEVIDKSRATYQKRYGSTVAASGNYFQNEVVRSLAEDDLSIMGSNFRQ